MSDGADWIVIRGTSTNLDGGWLERPFPSAARLMLGPGLTLRPTNGFEQDDEKGLAQVWKPVRGLSRPLSDILFKVSSTYGATPTEPAVPTITIENTPGPTERHVIPPTLLGKPIVEVGPHHFPPGTQGDIVLGPPEDIGKPQVRPKKGPSEPQERPER